MKVIEFEKDKLLVARFRGHTFELDRDPDEKSSFGNWYIVVKNDAGQTACDGYIDDSSHYTAKVAMTHACEYAALEPPKRWPKSILSHAPEVES